MQEISDFIGKSKFIYVSFGTTADITKGPKELKDKFINAYKNARDLKFIWKWEGDSKTLNLPPNVYTAKWMPQQEILGNSSSTIYLQQCKIFVNFDSWDSYYAFFAAHPQIVGFITHGGLLGTQEAIYHGVPMIAFPLFAEQDYNAERLSRMGRGIMMDIATFTSQDLLDAIQAISANPM